MSDVHRVRGPGAVKPLTRIALETAALIIVMIILVVLVSYFLGVFTLSSP